jgi:hypothetical protein
MNGSRVGAELDIPEGRLVRSRVGVAGALDAALSRDLTGYARIQPDSLLADGQPGVVTFEDGVPRAAYADGDTGHGRRDSRGVDALAALAGPGPCSVELYELPADALTEVHETGEFSVPPAAPAEELADDPSLAERARERAPADAHEENGPGALESFLEDEERIEAIQEEAREEAEKRAEEWGLDGELE